MQARRSLGLVKPIPPLGLSHLELVTPVWDLATLVGLGVPLYLVTMASQNLPGFAVLRASGYQPPTQPVLAVTGALSLGTAFLGLVLNEAFGSMGAERFYLDCFADNARAQRAYLKLGLSRDGVLRQAYRLADGTRTDLIMMAILKSEWEARRR